MKAATRRDVFNERVELLSSSSLEPRSAVTGLKPRDASFHENDDKENSERFKDGGGVMNGKSSEHLRFRDRLYNFFMRSKSKKTESLKPLEEIDENGTLPVRSKDSQYSFVLIEDEDEDIRRLRELIRNQEKEENMQYPSEDTEEYYHDDEEEEEEEETEEGEHNCYRVNTIDIVDNDMHSIVESIPSEDHDRDNETHLNTIRNQSIHLLPEEEGYEEDRESKEPDFTTLFADAHAEKNTSYSFQKRLVEANDYQLLYPWTLYNDYKFCNQFGILEDKVKKKLEITSKLMLSEIMNAFRNRFKGVKDFQTHLFRNDFDPNQDANYNGSTLCIKVPQHLGFQLWKTLLRVFIDDRFLQIDDLTVYKFKNSIFGLSFHLRNSKQRKNTKELLVKLAVKDEGIPFDQAEFVKLCLPPELVDSMKYARYYQNNKHESDFVYQFED